MDWTKITQFIEDKIRTFFEKNYSSGSPRLAPHQHNGIDNLRVKSTDLSGNVVTQIVAGANISVSPTTGIGAVTVTGTSSGGTPGGSDTQVQFNDSGAFGGDSAFAWNKTTNVLTLDDASATGYTGGDTITGGTSRLVIKTGDRSTNNTRSGWVSVYGGNHSGSTAYAGSLYFKAGDNSGTNGNAGSITLTAGRSTKTTGGAAAGGVFLYGGYSKSDNSPGGNVKIEAGYGKKGTGTASTGGDVLINGGRAKETGTLASGGNIVLTGGKDNNASSVGGIITVKPGDRTGTHIGSITLAAGGNNTTSGYVSASPELVVSTVLTLSNRASDPATPTSSGRLYTKSGALYFIGSGGTVTPLAPA